MLLSVLDQSPVSEGSSAGEAVRNTLDLARLADRLGYHRYWVAEHHDPAVLAGAAPEVLIGPIALATGRIRVGSGGVILPHYSPRRVAEVFTVLCGLIGDRVDLAVGRAAGTDDPAIIHALQRDRRAPSPDDFPEQLGELLAYVEGRPAPDRRFAGLPALSGRPQPWLLGSSMQSALWAAQLGLPYSFGDFINPAGAEIAALYRRQFSAGVRLPSPRLAVCVAVICAESEVEAARLAASRRMSSALKRRGELVPLPPVEKALRFLEAGGEPPGGSGRRAVTGSPGGVRAELEAIAGEYGADEVMVVTLTHSHEARRRSYELLAEAFGLPGDGGWSGEGGIRTHEAG